MTVRVIYSTDAFLRKVGDTGRQTESYFSSLEDAKAAALPEGHTFGFIPVENGHYVYHSPVFGWEFQEELTKEYVQKCVDDWLQRLDDLFRRIKVWAAQNEWTAEDGAPIPMHEEMMERFGVPARQQPTLLLRNGEGEKIRIKPKGLWVIGANGRVDMYSRKGAYTLVDVGDRLQGPPQWVLHFVGQTNGQPFDPEQLANMI